MNDVNKLKDILIRSKAVMDKTEKYSGEDISVSSEKAIPNLLENFNKTNSTTTTRSVSPKNGRYRNLKNTKMPQEIVEAMVNNPIEIPESPYPTFELDQVEDLVNESPQQRTQTHVAGSAQYNSEDIRQIVREEIGDVVREVVEEYLDKSLVTEDIKIKIGETIFGGKLKPLPKKRKKRI